ncbi:hypothetical protein GALMADRAFT_217266 [Galerina marginata CBS 339.88]|uniref:Uncharacterized protein n=1 Tax=Galerina marginata (strain CBS 339.88) TaxID=685588 RepID=A0A067SE20_GALM3|nr:hypothetical protein GALMADRAFT_217266 [Galerina marginata CBS 339.88]
MSTVNFLPCILQDRMWLLVNGNGDNKDIKNGLYPLPGGNMSLSKRGSKPKAEYHWALTFHIFGDDADYQEAITAAVTVGKHLQTAIRNIINEMGETGAGLTAEDQIDMSIDSAVTSVWTRVKEKHPWFWVFKSFISSRPNLIQTGVGNNSTGYNVGDKRQKAAAGSEQSKKKIKLKVNDKQPTAPWAGKSTVSTVTSSTQKKSKTGVEKFSEIVFKEEETTQKILNLKKTKAKGVTEKVIAKVKSKADVEMNRDKLKADLASKKLANKLEEKKLKFEYKFRMAELQARAQAPAHTTHQVLHHQDPVHSELPPARTQAPVHTHQVLHHQHPVHSAHTFAFLGTSSVQSVQSHPLYENTAGRQSMTEELNHKDLPYDSMTYNQVNHGDNYNQEGSGTRGRYVPPKL